MKWSTVSAVCAVSLLAAGCGNGSTYDEEDVAAAANSQALTQIEVNHRSISFDFAEFDNLPAGIAGGLTTVFVGQPLAGQVVALDRFSGEVIGALPLPDNGYGFILPFIMHQVGPHKVAVLDAGGLPSLDPFIPANPTIYEYEYERGLDGSFSATLTRTVSFADEVVGFAEDFTLLDDGRYVLSDAALGALWVANPDGTIEAGIAPATNEPEDAIPELVYCPDMPLVEVGGHPFLFTDSALPGVSSLAARDGMLYFSSPCAEGVYRVPISVLSDDRPPHERAADIELVSPKPDEFQVEELLGITFNPYNPWDDHLYAADALQLRVIRIDVETGEREVVADDPRLLNFPSSLAFLPPVIGLSPLAVVSNQQHLTPLTNDAATEDAFEPPFLATKIFVLDGHARGHASWGGKHRSARAHEALAAHGP